MIENLGDKAGVAGFHKNPQNINKKGRPVKLYNDCIKEQKAKGYSPPTKDEYYEMVGLLFVMSESDLDEFALNPDNPQYARRLVIDLESSKYRDKLNSEYRDWMFGKAEQKNTLVTEDENGTQKAIEIKVTGLGK